MLFGEVIGQPEVKQRLLHLVRENRVPHALMLVGPRGNGKLALAVAMAQYLSCMDRKDDDACGRCPSCIKFSKLVHPDLHFAVPVLKTTKVSKDPVTDHYMEEWRAAFLFNPYISENQWYEAIGAENKQGVINKEESLRVIRKLGFKPYESDFRMLVIWLPEKMNQAAANKLLKLIEEPAEDTVIWMVSENTDRMLPTILSRAQIVAVPPLTDELVRQGLHKKGITDPVIVEGAVRQCNGNFNAAIDASEQNGENLFELFTRLMRLCYARNILEINDWIEEVSALGRERQKVLLDYSLRMIRENFIFRLEEDKLRLMSGREIEFSDRFSAYIHHGNFFRMEEEFTMAARHIEANGNPRIVFMDLSVKIIRLLMQKETQTV